MEKATAKHRFQWTLNQRLLQRLDDGGLDSLVEKHMLYTAQAIGLCAENKSSDISLDLIQVGWKIKELSDSIDHRISLLAKEDYPKLSPLFYLRTQKMLTYIAKRCSGKDCAEHGRVHDQATQEAIETLARIEEQKPTETYTAATLAQWDLYMQRALSNQHNNDSDGFYQNLSQLVTVSQNFGAEFQDLIEPIEPVRKRSH